MRKRVKRIGVVLGGLVGLLAIALAGGLIYEKLSEARDAERFPPPGQLLDINGRKLHLRCTGSGSPAVLLEAGGASSSVQWGPVQEALAEFARVCSYDRAGFGWSDPSVGELSFEDGARDLKGLLTAAGVPGPYILVGHSKGGLHVRTYARLYPEDVSGVLLLDAAEEEHLFSQMESLESQATSGRLPGLLARFGVVRLLLRFSPQTLPLPEIPVEIRQIFHAELARPAVWRAATREVFAYRLTPPERRVAGGFGRLGDVPLIVITHGIPYAGGQASNEAGWPEAQKRLARLSSNGELLVAESSGHAIMWDEPALVVDAVRRLIAKAYP